MSVQFQHSTVDEQRLELPDEPADVFDALVQSDRICQRCLIRLRHHERYPDEAGLKHEPIAFYLDYDLPPNEPSWNKRDREYYETQRDHDRIGHLHSEDGRHSYCANCGTTDPHRRQKTRSVSEARDAAINLSVTLREFGVEHDWMMLAEAVKLLKRNPNTAGDEHRCFREATRLAIEQCTAS